MASDNLPAGGGKEQWATRIGVILAVAGSAVGLGNFLRFPGQAAQNGGGAFLLPYFISLLVIGIPLCWAEWTMGRYAGHRGFNSAPGVYSVIWRNRFAKYLGGIALLIPLTIYMWYVLVEAWCLGYAMNYLTGDLMLGNNPEAYSDFFAKFVGSSEDGAIFAPGARTWLWVLVATFIFNFILIYRGVNKGIEAFCKIAMPLMIVLSVVVLVRVLTLGVPNPDLPDRNVRSGLGYMWNPDFGALTDPQTWLAASGQIFFSLSVGFGIIINYASYLKRNDDVALSGLTSSSLNEFFEVCLGGLITIPAAFMFLGALEPGTLKSAFSLGFEALPNVFASMWGGRVFGFLWFFVLFIAALTSSVSMLQPVIAFLEEGLGLKRHAAAAILGLISATGTGFIVYFSKDLMALDTFDFWTGTFMIVVLALVQSILYGWVFGIKRGHEELHVGAHIRVPWFVQLMLKYVVPVYLAVILGAFCWDKLPSKEEELMLVPDTTATQFDEDLVRELFALGEIELPERIQVTTDHTIAAVQIRNEEGHMLFTIHRNGERSRAIFKYVPGYVEKIGRDRTSLMSVLFLCVTFAFLLLLIHIAGERWQAEGRYKDLT